MEFLACFDTYPYKQRGFGRPCAEKVAHAYQVCIQNIKTGIAPQSPESVVLSQTHHFTGKNRLEASIDTKVTAYIQNGLMERKNE